MLDNLINDNLDIHVHNVAPYIEAEMWCGRLADRMYVAESRKTMALRRKVMVYSSDSDILAYTSSAAAQRGVGWWWVTNVVPNVHNPQKQQLQLAGLA